MRQLGAELVSFSNRFVSLGTLWFVLGFVFLAGAGKKLL